MPSIRTSGGVSTDIMAQPELEPPQSVQLIQFRQFLYQMQGFKLSWPFLKPVDSEEVPDYYDIVTKPMDMSTIEQKIEAGAYDCPKRLVMDFQLIYNNCHKYNNEDSVYVRSARAVERHMWYLIKEFPEWHHLLEEYFGPGNFDKLNI